MKAYLPPHHCRSETVKTLYPVREEMRDFLERLENLINEFTTLHPLPVDTQD